MTTRKSTPRVHMQATDPVASAALRAADGSGEPKSTLVVGYIALKMQEVTKFRAATHPLEYAMYYQL